jgi:hypothetical protein
VKFDGKAAGNTPMSALAKLEADSMPGHISVVRLAERAPEGPAPAPAIREMVS